MTAYDEGFSSALYGEYDDANPHPAGSHDSDSWLEGWVSGKAYMSEIV